jgi:hypothetical protein
MLPIKFPVRLPQPAGLVFTLLAVIFFTFFGPLEKTLGVNIRLVYLHGAWVWVGLAAFAAAAVAGLLGLVSRARLWHDYSRSLALTALIFWLTYLPISMLLMQINWGGFFFDEPRWRIPFTFAVIAVLLQSGLFLINHLMVSSIANLIFAAALFWSLNRVTSILHPDSPIFGSGSISIQVFFILLLFISLLAGWQINSLIFKKISRKHKVGEAAC